jgi:excisionase family DNA binding protein
LSEKQIPILDPNQRNVTKVHYSLASAATEGAMPHDRYQTVKEVAERLEVAEATVRQWIKSGALRAIYIGKGWRVADADLEAFMIARETVPRNVTCGKSQIPARAGDPPKISGGEDVR